jgi:Tfp pilus assembly protein PilV
MRRKLITPIGRPEDGFGMIEIIMAAFVLAVGVLALLDVFSSAGKGTETSNQQDAAAAVATQALESMRSYPYAALALNGTIGPSGTVTALPDGRLRSNGQFQATSSTSETIDNSVLPVCSSSLTTSCSPFAPSSSGSINGTSYTLYRIVSWDSQSCPINNLASTAVANLSSALGSLYTDTSTVETLLATLNGAGTNSISKAVSALATLILHALNPLLTDFTQLKNDLNTLATTIGTSASGLQGRLATVWSDLQTLNSEGYLTTSGLTAAATAKLNNLDLCELINVNGAGLIPNTSSISALATGLGGSTGTGGIYANLSSAQTDTSAAAGFSLLTPAATVTATDTDVVSRNGSITTSMSASGSVSTSAVSGVQTSLTNLSNLMSCLTNSSTPCETLTPHVKRISVAVVLNSIRKGTGPQDAVWMSSLVADPADGLL